MKIKLPLMRQRTSSALAFDSNEPAFDEKMRKTSRKEQHGRKQSLWGAHFGHQRAGNRIKYQKTSCSLTLIVQADVMRPVKLLGFLSSSIMCNWWDLWRDIWHTNKSTNGSNSVAAVAVSLKCKSLPPRSVGSHTSRLCCNSRWQDEFPPITGHSGNLLVCGSSLVQRGV